MSNNMKQRTLKLLQEEWGTYIERFKRLPAQEQTKRVKEQGYESFRDILAHILAWWEEGLEVILATAEGRETPRKTYDEDVFNAEAVGKYKSWNETKFLAHFESTRLKMESSLRSLPEAAFENRRIQRWLYGILIEHARDHIVALSRRLVMDTLENEWAGYIEKFSQLDAGKQKEFLSKQGFENFHDLVAHVIGWFEETLRMATNIVENPGYMSEDHDVDVFNVELVKKFGAWSDKDLYLHFENVRRSLHDLVDELPDDAFKNQEIESWLAGDVVEHFNEHAL